MIGKAAAVTKIASQSSANRAKHFRDVDSLARLLGPGDRSTANLSSSERRLLEGFIDQPDLSDVAAARFGSFVPQVAMASASPSE